MSDEIKKIKKKEGIPTDIDIEITSPKAKAVLLAIVALLVVTFSVYQVYVVKGSRVEMKTQTAIYQTVTRSVSANGFVLREEQYVRNPYSGTVVPAVSNGTKVAAGDTVSKIFPTASAAAAAVRLEELEESIEFYHSVISASTGVQPADLQLYKQNVVTAMIGLTDAASSGDLTRFSALTRDLRGAMTKKQIAYGNQVDVSDKLAELLSERSALQYQLSEYSSITAEAAGYYVATSDGYENVFPYENALTLSVQDVDRLNEMEPSAVPGGTVGKLVTKFNWYLVCNVKAREIDGISTGKTVGVSFPGSAAGTVNMYVCAINAEKNSEDVTLVLKSNKMNAAVASLRKESVKICVEEYDGFVVEPKAVRTVDGVTGVYVKLGNIVRFRKIDIGYSDDSMILATVPDGGSGYLKQYDEIIIEGTNLYDGKNLD